MNNKDQASRPAAWAAINEDGDIEALGMNESRRFDTPLFTAAQVQTMLAAAPPAATAKVSNDMVSRQKFNRTKHDLEDAQKELKLFRSKARQWDALVHHCQQSGQDLDVGMRAQLAITKEPS